MARTRRSGLPEYKSVGTGSCLDKAGKNPRVYFKSKAFSTISGCRDLCTTLSAACVGYYFSVSGFFAGACGFYGSKLPDQGTGAAAPGKALYRWNFNVGAGGSDTLTRGDGGTNFECHAKQPCASGTHPSSPPPPYPLDMLCPHAAYCSYSSSQHRWLDCLARVALQHHIRPTPPALYLAERTHVLSYDIYYVCYMFVNN